MSSKALSGFAILLKAVGLLLLLTIRGFCGELSGKNAIVTGGSRGVGEACVHALAKAGANVAIVVSGDIEEANRVAAQVEESGASTYVVACDVSNPHAVQAMVESVSDRWGHIDILVNAAKVAERASAENLRYKDWQKVIHVNLTGTFLCCQAVGKHMISHSIAGVIINLGSMSGHVVVQPQKQCHYNASKAGILLLTQSLAHEWADRGIRVNAVSPGYIASTVPESLVPLIPQWIEKIPLKTLTTTQDIADAILQLILSPFSGTELIIDGGYTAI